MNKKIGERKKRGKNFLTYEIAFNCAELSTSFDDDISYTYINNILLQTIIPFPHGNFCIY